MYYYQGLYGHKSQSVLYIEPLHSDQQIQSLKDLSQKYQRKLLFIYRHDRSSSRLDLIRSAFSLSDHPETINNQIWRIVLEASP
ncbi:MAG: hypothetical protein QGG39_14400 [Candidatus Poribacteria bacterium]|nr:hypothetical protein [Candidatus Poribacteria bacterium]